VEFSKPLKLVGAAKIKRANRYFRTGAQKIEFYAGPFKFGISIDINLNSNFRLAEPAFLIKRRSQAKKNPKNPSGLNFLSPPLRRKALLSVGQLLGRCLLGQPGCQLFSHTP